MCFGLRDEFGWALCLGYFVCLDRCAVDRAENTRGYTNTHTHTHTHKHKSTQKHTGTHTSGKGKPGYSPTET